MSKKSEGSGGSSTRLVTTLATTGGLMVLRKVLAAAWTKVTGRNPPTDLTDPKVTLPEALAWGVAPRSSWRRCASASCAPRCAGPASDEARNLARAS